jgi:thiol-disulfide isomerase/thioredoxin
MARAHVKPAQPPARIIYTLTCTFASRLAGKAVGRTVAAMLLALGGLLISAGPAAADDTPLLGNDQRLRFYGTQLDGALFDGRSLIGRPAVLWFWTPAPYCGVCLQEAPIVANVAARHPAVAFVGVAGRWDVLSMRRVVSDVGMNFTNLTDANGMIWQAFFVPWPPAFAFLRADGSGYLLNNIVAPMSEDELDDRVNGLLGPQQ